MRMDQIKELHANENEEVIKLIRRYGLIRRVGTKIYLPRRLGAFDVGDCPEPNELARMIEYSFNSIWRIVS